MNGIIVNPGSGELECVFVTLDGLRSLAPLPISLMEYRAGNLPYEIHRFLPRRAIFNWSGTTEPEDDFKKVLHRTYVLLSRNPVEYHEVEQ